ncbi:E1-E2 ATPase-domain-containing protein [Bisporella sp. PMI_857]|nr:E1-E2 ATPase-domain-containing protein [Bisporella sp. PMI_857]
MNLEKRSTERFASRQPSPEGCSKDECCSGEKEQTKDGLQDKCCSDEKQKNCCDDSCIDRLAVRECESSCGDNNDARSSTSRERSVTGSACRTHKKLARNRYAAKLAALGCICRALVALGEESCCATKKRPTSDIRQARNKSSHSSRTSGIDYKAEPMGSSLPQEDSCGTAMKLPVPNCKAGCCEPKATTTVKPKRSKQGENSEIKEQDDAFNYISNMEKGAAGNEFIALSISGMTCTGCETKLQRVLGTVPAISNLKTSLVMSRTEFNLDVRVMSADSVIKHIERTTEFKCERISTQGSSINVLPLGDVKDFLNQNFPAGVSHMQAVDKSTVCIAFDPKVVGARDLIDLFAQPSTLAAPTPDPGLTAGSKHVRKMGYMTALSVVLTIPVLVLAWAPIGQNDIAYGSASLALATLIQFIVAGPFYPKAIKSLIFSRMIEMDLLIVLSTSAAYIFSVVSFGYLVSGHPLSTGEFFETSTLLVSLIMVGRYISALARQKAVESISIRSLQTSRAQLANDDGSLISEIDARLLQYGDIFSVLPEARIPTDGVVIGGCSEVDESMLTGESRPVEKEIGSKVIAGSVNGSGKLLIRLTRLPGENTISSIASMVDDAKLSKPKIQDMADTIASYFVPLIVFLTMVTFSIWIAIGITVRQQSGSEAAIHAITFAITVLIVSCPCAIGLAVPMVIVIGSGVAAEHGVIFKSANSIEAAYKTTHVVFDKTGTLTEGKLKVVEERVTVLDKERIRSQVLGLVANSKHPVSAAVASYLVEQGVRPARIDGIKAIVGNGIEGTINGKVLRGGNVRWLDVGSDLTVKLVIASGYTTFGVTLNSELCIVFGLSDSIRPDAADTILELKQSGVFVSLLSGDDDGAVQKVAAQLNIDLDRVRSRCSPGEKQEYIRKLSEEPSEKKPIIVFVGDGTNDAVALAQATIGVHMNSGTDVAQSAADVVLMRSTLKSVVKMIKISHAAVLRIKFNFAWAFVYNLLAILLGSGALVAANKGNGVRIPPEYAGLGELISVLPVITIAITLKWAKF